MSAASASARIAARKAMWVRPMMGAPLALMLVVFLVYPVGQLLLLSFYTDSGFSLAHYRQLFASSVYVDVLLITLKISLFTTLLSIIAGYPIAYLVSMVGRRERRRFCSGCCSRFGRASSSAHSRGSCCSAATA